MTTKGLRRAAGGLLALLVVGCGLGKYEDAMRATRDRVARYDEEVVALGDPVQIPTKRVAPAKEEGKKDGGKDTAKKAAPKQPVQEERKPVIDYAFFFRVPRGIRATPDQEPLGGLAYHYGKSATAPPAITGIGAVTTGKGGEMPSGAAAPVGITDVYLAFSNEPAGVFVDKVVKALGRNTGPVMARQRDVQVLDRKDSLGFDVREFDEGPASWAVYAHNEGGNSVAIVFKMEKNRKGSLDRAIELSLATLAMGTEANLVRASYERRR